MALLLSSFSSPACGSKILRTLCTLGLCGEQSLRLMSDLALTVSVSRRVVNRESIARVHQTRSSQRPIGAARFARMSLL